MRSTCSRPASRRRHDILPSGHERFPWVHHPMDWLQHSTGRSRRWPIVAYPMSTARINNSRKMSAGDYKPWLKMVRKPVAIAQKRPLCANCGHSIIAHFAKSSSKPALPNTVSARSSRFKGPRICPRKMIVRLDSRSIRTTRRAHMSEPMFLLTLCVSSVARSTTSGAISNEFQKKRPSVANVVRLFAALNHIQDFL
jgi:hypothetical protein